MRSPGINGEGELRGQPANPGSPGKMAVKTECVCVCARARARVCVCAVSRSSQQNENRYI